MQSNDSTNSTSFFCASGLSFFYLGLGIHRNEHTQNLTSLVKITL